MSERQLRPITHQHITKIADNAEDVINSIPDYSRTAKVRIIENAIRQALQVVDAKVD